MAGTRAPDLAAEPGQLINVARSNLSAFGGAVHVMNTRRASRKGNSNKPKIISATRKTKRLVAGVAALMTMSKWSSAMIDRPASRLWRKSAGTISFA